MPVGQAGGHDEDNRMNVPLGLPIRGVAAAPAAARGRFASIALTLRLALRDLRGGLRGFYVFIACIALGVAAIAAVGSFADSLADGLGREGRVILGGDVAFSLIQREADAA